MKPEPKVSYGTIIDRRYSFSATPEDTYRPFRIKKKREKPEHWVATEHSRVASQMERGFRYDDKGRKMTELGSELILDPRPTIMRPERRAIFLGLDQM